MKTIVNYILILLLCLLSSCSDIEVEKKLDGKWCGQCVLMDDADDNTVLNIYMTLDKETHNFSMKINVKSPELGKIAVARFKGTWKADEDDIMVDVDKNSVNIKFEEELALLAELTGLNLKYLEAQLEQELSDGISGFGLLPIKSLKDDQLKLEMFESLAVFEKDRTELVTVVTADDVMPVDSTESGYDYAVVAEEYVEEYVSPNVAYVGKVAGKDVSMELTYSDGSVSGRYRYNSINPPSWLELNGEYDGEYLTLTERNSDGMQTASFNLRVNHNSTPVKIFGKIVNYKGKSYEVELEEL